MLKIYAIFGLSAAFIALSLACSCIRLEQQVGDMQLGTWCYAHWISKVNISQKIPDKPIKISKNVTLIGQNLHYVASHLEIFKGKQNISKNIFTTRTSASCGVDYLEPGLTYLLSGFYGEKGKLRINLCFFMPIERVNGHPEWSTVPDELYKRLKSGNFTRCRNQKKKIQL
uniref:NTR domain-containing protein n=1 Tax=Acrobeloides nanus TaxID=290746 RepID=A0A914DZC0_9BILA